MMSTAENISATRTAKQQTRAKTTMHFCCDWKREGIEPSAVSGCKHKATQVRARGHKATQALRLFKTSPCVLRDMVVNTWLSERGRSLGENTQGFYVDPATRSSTSSRLLWHAKLSTVVPRLQNQPVFLSNPNAGYKWCANDGHGYRTQKHRCQRGGLCDGCHFSSSLAATNNVRTLDFQWEAESLTGKATGCPHLQVQAWNRRTPISMAKGSGGQ